MLRLATLFIAIVAVKEIAAGRVFSDWSKCSMQYCGIGYQRRWSRCPDHPKPGSETCHGEGYYEYKDCDAGPCTGPEDGEYKMVNKRWGGTLFGGSDKDSANDHWAWVKNRINYDYNGKERVYLRKQLDGTYKIFSKKWKGPLFCGSDTNKDGNHWAWFEESPSYESNGKERWTIEMQPDDGYYKLINKKSGGALFCGEETDSAGDHWVLVEPRPLFSFYYVNRGKQHWDFQRM